MAVTGSVAESGPDRHYDLLAVSDRKTALAPSLIWTSPEGGQLWLSGLPLKKTIGSYPTVALQICCMAQTLQERGGVTLPGAVTRQLPIGGKERDDAFKNVFQIVRQTLANGAIHDHLRACTVRLCNLRVFVGRYWPARSKDDNRLR